jgi:transcriptional regulator with XRE-family HTH domain
MVSKRSSTKRAVRDSAGISQAEFGRHIDVSQQRVQQMLAAGTIQAMINGKINPEVARVQYIRSLRRSPGSEEVRRVAAARARHIEIQNEKQLSKLIDNESVLMINGEIITVFCGELHGIPAASARGHPAKYQPRHRAMQRAL